MRKNIMRGEVYYADLDPVVGSEQGGTRPVVIIQNNTGNKYGSTVIVAAVTKKIKHGMPTHVLLAGNISLPYQSMALMEQLRTIDKIRLKEYVGRLDKDTMMEIDEVLLIGIGVSRVKNK